MRCPEQCAVTSPARPREPDRRGTIGVERGHLPRTDRARLSGRQHPQRASGRWPEPIAGFYNPYHPGYARWEAEWPREADVLLRPDGDAWWEQAQQYSLERGFSILLESAMVNPAEYEDICRRIQSAPLPPGVTPYRIETAFIALPGLASRVSVTFRYLESSRSAGTAVSSARPSVIAVALLVRRHALLGCSSPAHSAPDAARGNGGRWAW
ncbi:zeta toxin family protein [Streptomyces parvulus]|uniref:zeta toxin family protein n=1 Tax=Streptomyces parvulus TaxID=146923 RepID=UPI0036A54B27